MEFQVLGPLRARVRGRWKELAAPKQRAILGLMVANANRAIFPDQVLEEVWGPRPPEGGIQTLRYHVSKLRDTLEPGRPRGEGGVIATEGGGYVLHVDDGELDANQFDLLAAVGARALSDHRISEARAKLDEALGLWRGEAYHDLRYEAFAQSEIARLEEARLVCLENRVAADLELGRHRDILGELRELTTQYPLREEFWGHLMVALYRSGQQSEALRAYRTARRVLGEELGIEPNTALQRLEEQILLHELPFEAPPEALSDRPSLPARSDSFVGRTQDVRTVESPSGRATRNPCVSGGFAASGAGEFVAACRGSSSWEPFSIGGTASSVMRGACLGAFARDRAGRPSDILGT